MNTFRASIEAVEPFMIALEWVGIAYVAYIVYKIAKWMNA